MLFLVKAKLESPEAHWPPVDSRFHISTPGKKIVLSAGDHGLANKAAWVEALELAVGQPSGQSTVDVSCEEFSDHPTFGLKHCRSCGVGKTNHFSAAAEGFGTDPLVDHEGMLFIHKTHNKFAAGFSGEWKKRHVGLKGSVLKIASEQGKDQHIRINTFTKLTRRSGVGDDDDGEDTGADEKRFEFSVECVLWRKDEKPTVEIKIFAASSPKER